MPYFPQEEVASAVGNFSVVCPSVFLLNSDRFMRKMKDIIASDLQHMNSNDAGLLKVAYHVSLTSSSNSLLGKIS